MFYTENLYCTIKIGFRRSSPKLFCYSAKILGLGVRSRTLVKAISEVVLQVLDKQHQLWLLRNGFGFMPVKHLL